MRSTKRQRVIASTLALAAALSLSGCSMGPSEDDKKRDELQSKKATGPTLEKANLDEKRKREENPNAIGYLYVLSFGKILGYYVTKGKISSNGSQATPEQSVDWTCHDWSASRSCESVVVDGPQDDGSYGSGDPGIFFFLADGTKVVTNLDYLQTDRPIPGLGVPDLGAK